MRFFRTVIVLAVALLSGIDTVVGKRNEVCDVEKRVSGSNNCVQFSVTSGTGCAWMCNY